MSASAPSSRWSTVAPARPGLLAGGLLVLAAFAAYAGSFSGPFIFDDVLSIPQNPTIRHLSSAFLPPGGGLTVSGRPLLNLSLALNHAISGDEVWSYHALNLLIHILAGLILFGIVRRTLVRTEGKGGGVISKAGSGQVSSKTGRHRRWPPTANTAEPGDSASQDHATFLAFAAALLWTVHPLQTEAVTYLAQRSESLMGLFYLLTLYGFIRGTEIQERLPRPGPAGRSRWRLPPGAGWFALSVAACAGGMATKEVMVSAPVMTLLYDRTFVAGSFSVAWRRRRRVHVALAATWMLLAGLVAGAGNRGGTAGFDIGVGFWKYAATQFQAVVHYLWLALWPHPLILDYGAAWVRGAGQVVPYVPVVTLLVAGTAVALCRRPAAGFMGAWFLAILAPTSLVPSAVQTLAEHRMYLALAPVTVLLVLALNRWLGRRSWVVLLAAAVGLGAMTAQRNRSYRSARAIWRDTVAKRPSNPGAHVNLGNALEADAENAEALAQFEAAIRLKPSDAAAVYDAGGACLRLHRYAEAVAHYRRALALHLEYPDVYANLGDALVRAGRAAEAVGEYETALRMTPGSAEAEYHLANALAQAGQPAAAVRHLEAALHLRPDYARAANNLGNLRERAGDLTGAIAQYEAALRDDPLLAVAHENLGSALLQSGRLEDAQLQFEWVLRLHPDSAAAARDLGVIRLRLGRPEQARVWFERVLALNPGDAIAHYNLGCAFVELGRRSEAKAEFEAVLRLRPDFEPARENLERIEGGR